MPRVPTVTHDMNPVEKAARALIDYAEWGDPLPPTPDGYPRRQVIVRDEDMDALKAAVDALSSLPSAPAVGVEEVARVLLRYYTADGAATEMEEHIAEEAAREVLALLRPDTAEPTPEKRCPSCGTVHPEKRWHIGCRFYSADKGGGSLSPDWELCLDSFHTPPATPARASLEEEGDAFEAWYRAHDGGAYAPGSGNYNDNHGIAWSAWQARARAEGKGA